MGAAVPPTQDFPEPDTTQRVCVDVGLAPPLLVPVAAPWKALRWAPTAGPRRVDVAWFSGAPSRPENTQTLPGARSAYREQALYTATHRLYRRARPTHICSHVQTIPEKAQRGGGKSPQITNLHAYLHFTHRWSPADSELTVLVSGRISGPRREVGWEKPFLKKK